jgi:hypothetical protein
MQNHHKTEDNHIKAAILSTANTTYTKREMSIFKLKTSINVPPGHIEQLMFLCPFACKFEMFTPHHYHPVDGRPECMESC